MRRKVLTVVVSALVVVVVGLTATLIWMSRVMGEWRRQALAEAPPAWMDTIRYLSSVPELTGVAVARTEEGDGAELLYDTAQTWRAPEGILNAFGAMRGDSGTAADSALWRSVAADRDLDRVAAFARRRGWNGTARTTEQAERTGQTMFYELPIPPVSRFSEALVGLMIRARVRASRGEVVRSRQDLAAVLALAEQVARHEPMLIGAWVGRYRIGAAADEYRRLSETDAALRERLDSVAAWGLPRRGLLWTTLLGAEPDSALALAADTSAALGWRSEAMAQYLAANLSRLRTVAFGIPVQVRSTIHDWGAQSGDPRVVSLAGALLAACDSINAAGMGRRLTYASVMRR